MGNKSGYEVEDALSPEDRAFLEDYRKTVRGTLFPDEEEMWFLLGEMTGAAGDGMERAREKLTAMLLPVVPQVVLEYAGQELPLADLVQEGNLGLMTALAAMYDAGFMSPEEILPYVRGEIRAAAENALARSQGESRKGRLIAGRVNELSDRIKELAEELGGTPTIDEASIFLEMPVEEIEALIRLTGEGSGDDDADDGGGTASVS